METYRRVDGVLTGQSISWQTRVKWPECRGEQAEFRQGCEAPGSRQSRNDEMAW